MKAVFWVSFGALVLVSGCASVGLSQADCAAMDWQQVGLEDGQTGAGPFESNELQQQCSEIGAPVDSDEYQTGFAQGVRSFCQPDNGFDAGVSGYQYSGICPAELAGGFIQQYNIGIQFHYIHRDISAIESAISGNQDSIDKLTRGIATNEIKLADDELDVREQVVLEQEIQSMESQIEEFQRTEPQLTAALLQRQGQLEELKNLHGK